MWSDDRTGSGLPPRPAGTDASSIRYSTTRVAVVAPSRLRERGLVVDDDAPEADALRMLRMQVLQRLDALGATTLMVTSARTGEGRTLVAANLALQLAASTDRTALLVEADLRRPSLRALLDLPDDRGLADCLAGRAAIDELLVNPGIPRLVVLPAGRATSESLELLASTAMARLMREIKDRYPDRLVILDVPAVLDSADALAIAPLADAVLLVVEDRKSREDDVVRALEILQPHPVIGCVLNRAQGRSGAEVGR